MGAALQPSFTYACFLFFSPIPITFMVVGKGKRRRDGCLHFTIKYRLAGVMGFRSCAMGFRGLEVAQSTELAVLVYMRLPVT